MRTNTVCRHLAVAAILVIAGTAAVACGREQDSLTAPASLVKSLSPSSSPRTYSWAVTCNPVNGDASFFWSWQLADGTTVSGGGAGCGQSGTGTIPLTATGIEVDGDIFGGLGGCEDYKTVTKSVSGSGSVSVSMHLSLPSSTGTFGGTIPCPMTGSASFKLGNN